ncbi:MAG: ECF transporter S component [Candidatus Nealsonbacteria bacterium]|nr:ECF transporter S component [Candidatus Nealsonbacteria bacterium]
MFTQTKSLPKVLTFSETKYYLFSGIFTASAVFLPWLAHQYHLVGPQFLPMHFFVLIAGFLFGWRTGLLVGALSPLMSFSITHMPPMIILPQVVLELAVYGFAIGLLREKNINILVALLGAMVLGRLARVLFILIITPKMDFTQFIQISLPGIILQLALIPFIIYFLQRFVLKDKEGRV